MWTVFNLHLVHLFVFFTCFIIRILKIQKLTKGQKILSIGWNILNLLLQTWIYDQNPTQCKWAQLRESQGPNWILGTRLLLWQRMKWLQLTGWISVDPNGPQFLTKNHQGYLSRGIHGPSWASQSLYKPNRFTYLALYSGFGYLSPLSS